MKSKVKDKEVFSMIQKPKVIMAEREREVLPRRWMMPEREECFLGCFVR